MFIIFIKFTYLLYISCFNRLNKISTKFGNTNKFEIKYLHI